MPPPSDECTSCNGKWLAESGGLCQICRTLDRISAFVRGPQVPGRAGRDFLQRLREYSAELTDLSEIHRGVVPDPSGVESRREEPKAEPGPPAATAKVKSSPSTVRPKEEKPPAAHRASSSHRPKQESRHGQKSKRKDLESSPSPPRSRRSRPSKREEEGEEGPSPRLASPVRAPDHWEESPEVKEEDSTPSEEREDRKERKKRPRSPSGPPPADRQRGRRPEPSHRPEGRHWRGPIRALPRQPPPGQGKHYGKNKGESKRKRGWNWNRGGRR